MKSTVPQSHKMDADGRQGVGGQTNRKKREKEEEENPRTRQLLLETSYEGGKNGRREKEEAMKLDAFLENGFDCEQCPEGGSCDGTYVTVVRIMPCNLIADAS